MKTEVETEVITDPVPGEPQTEVVGTPLVDKAPNPLVTHNV